ncbi:hypothetical protein ACJX0J_016518, partial [Zea mays]
SLGFSFHNESNFCLQSYRKRRERVLMLSNLCSVIFARTVKNKIYSSFPFRKHYVKTSCGTNVFDIGGIDEGEFYVNDAFKWVLAVVYGPAQVDKKELFLAELLDLKQYITSYYKGFFKIFTKVLTNRLSDIANNLR